MNKWFEILVGLVLLIASIYAWGMNFAGFGTAAVTFLKGGIIWSRDGPIPLHPVTF